MGEGESEKKVAKTMARDGSERIENKKRGAARVDCLESVCLPDSDSSPTRRKNSGNNFYAHVSPSHLCTTFYRLRSSVVSSCSISELIV